MKWRTNGLPLRRNGGFHRGLGVFGVDSAGFFSCFLRVLFCAVFTSEELMINTGYAWTLHIGNMFSGGIIFPFLPHFFFLSSPDSVSPFSF